MASQRDNHRMKKKPYTPPPNKAARLANSINLQDYKPGMTGTAPDRHSPEYIEWANYHRRVLKMPMIHEVRPDGSFLTASSL